VNKMIISRVCLIAAVVMLILGTVFLALGFNKKDVYYNGTFTSENVYVGGDAYNYIINANYFTGYVMLASSFYICTALFLCSGLYFWPGRYEGIAPAAQTVAPPPAREGDA